MMEQYAIGMGHAHYLHPVLMESLRDSWRAGGGVWGAYGQDGEPIKKDIINIYAAPLSPGRYTGVKLDGRHNLGKTVQDTLSRVHGGWGLPVIMNMLRRNRADQYWAPNLGPDQADCIWSQWLMPFRTWP